MKKFLPEIKGSTKIILGSTAPLVIAVLLTILVGNFGIARIKDIRSKITKAESDKSILTQKLNLLQTVSQTIASDAPLVSSAIPDSNSSLIVISQLRLLSVSNGLVLTNIKVSAPVNDAAGLTRADISFNAAGSEQGVINFVKGISGFSPLSVPGKFKMTQSAGSTQAQITVSAFWAPFPTKIPAVTQAITDLTAPEKTILTQISSLSQPIITQANPGGSTGRSDPFTQ